MVSRQLLVLTSLFLASASAWAMPRGTIIIRGLNKEMSDVSWEVKGSQVKVMTDRGVRMFDLDDVELIPEIGVVDRDAPPKLPSRLQEKLQRRLTLLPPKGWRPVDFKQPLLAEAYKHPTAEAYLELWISPPGDYEFATEPGRLQNTRISDEAAKSLALRYAEAQRPTFAWAELAGKILLYGKGSIEVFGSEESWRLEEYRLRHGELEFAVAVRVENKTKLTDTSVEELLTRFSFLSPVSSTPERYIDQELGFYMLAPRSSWTLLARPFSRVEPVVATRGSGGDAEVRVEVLPSGTAQGIADDVVQEHKQQNSGFLEVKAVERSTRDGQEVVFYRLDDYPRGRRVLHSFMGLAVKTAAGKLLHFRGMADISDEESAKELRLLLDGVRFLGGDRSALESDLEAARAAADAQACMERNDYSGAISALDRCLQAFPDYVPAILFRAEAKKASGDFSGYREDLELAQRYDPSVEGATGPEAYVEEAKAAERERDYAQACRSWVIAFKKSDDPKHLSSLTKAMSSWWNEIKRGKSTDGLDRQVGEIEEAVEEVDREELVQKQLSTIFTAVANEFKKDKDWSKAFRFANKLKRLGRDYRGQAEQLREQIKTARDRDRK